MSFTTDYTIDPREMGKQTYTVTVSRLIWQVATIEVDAYDDDDAIDQANYCIGFNDPVWQNDEIIQIEHDVEVS